jgi:hypothetical protein
MLALAASNEPKGYYYRRTVGLSNYLSSLMFAEEAHQNNSNKMITCIGN